MTLPISYLLPQWGEDQEKLLKALKVLSKVNPNDKIRILSQDAIAIENRYSAFRLISGDGCLPTLQFIDKVLRNSFSFAACTKKYFNGKSIKLSELETPKGLDTSEQNLHAKFLEMRGTLKTALWGIDNLRNLYASPGENEQSVSSELTTMINGSELAFESLFEKDETIPNLPIRYMPSKIQHIILNESRLPVSCEGVMSLIALGYQVSTWYGFTISAAGAAIGTYQLIYPDGSISSWDFVNSAVKTGVKVLKVVEYFK